MVCEFYRVALVVAVMIGFGSLGSYCNRIFSRGDINGNHLTTIIPGVAAAFVVPMFLSVGDSGIFEEALKSPDGYWYKIFIIAGFSTLAGASAPSFINVVAQKALQLSEQTHRDVQDIEKTTGGLEEALEATDENAEDVNVKANSVDDAIQKLVLEEYSVEDNRYKVIKALIDSKFSKRTVGGIAKSSGLTSSQVRSALFDLVRKGRVSEDVSKVSGNPMYALILSN